MLDLTFPTDHAPDLGKHGQVRWCTLSKAVNGLVLACDHMFLVFDSTVLHCCFGQPRRCKSLVDALTFQQLTVSKVKAAGLLPFLERWSTNSSITFAIVSGILPPLVSGLFTFFFPRIMRWLSQYMGALTHARLDRAVIARYFAFLVISQLVIFTLIGVAFSELTYSASKRP